MPVIENWKGAIHTKILSSAARNSKCKATNTKPTTFYCPLCTIVYYTEKELSQHIEWMHVITYEEKKEWKEVARSNKRENRVVCTTCWRVFHSNETLLHHVLNCRKHLVKSRYIEGTGCDLCSVPFQTNLSARHFVSEKHMVKSHYQKGSGCDICKLSASVITADWGSRPSSPWGVLPPMEDHNRRNESLHKQNYIKGSGCDLCCLSQHHEQSKKHLNTLRRLNYIYEQRLIPNAMKKSARNLVP